MEMARTSYNSISKLDKVLSIGNVSSDAYDPIVLEACSDTFSLNSLEDLFPSREDASAFR